jgi:hypothetical protein
MSKTKQTISPGQLLVFTAVFNILLALSVLALR